MPFSRDRLIKVMRSDSACEKRARWVSPDALMPGDVVLVPMKQPYEEPVKRRPIRLTYKRDINNLVLVRRVERQGQTWYFHLRWVAPDNVRPDDEVIENGDIVKPYRYEKYLPAEEPSQVIVPPIKSRSSVLLNRILKSLD